MTGDANKCSFRRRARSKSAIEIARLKRELAEQAEEQAIVKKGGNTLR
jgi:hypothetical protein